MELLTIKGTNLNTTVYRGFASIKDIATISAPDTFKRILIRKVFSVTSANSTLLRAMNTLDLPRSTQTLTAYGRK